MAEDHLVVREAIGALLQASGGFLVVGQARTGGEAVALAAKLKPDLIVMDVAMPELNGCEATRRIIARDPRARVLALSAYSDDEYVLRLVAVGALGFVAKHSSGALLMKAIREVAAGKAFFSPNIARRLLRSERLARDLRKTACAPGNLLTSREEEVLQLVAEGAANKQIAARLEISIKTVEKHRQRLMTKLDIHETAGLTRYAIASGRVEA
ncbi:MAG: response regulator transcription factor [Opitutaceae bacterium]